MSFNQKSLSGGGNRDASTPSFTNAPICRYIAYKNCCPPTCDPNFYIYLSGPPPGPLEYSDGTNGTKIGFKNIIPRPCNPEYIIRNVFVWPLIGFFQIDVNKDFFEFSNIIIKEPFNYILSINDINSGYPEIQSNGDRRYRWTPPGGGALSGGNMPLGWIPVTAGGKYTLSFS